jgi:hypothetical protein
MFYDAETLGAGALLQAGRPVRSAQELVMSAGPLYGRPRAPPPESRSSKTERTPPSQSLRLPEDRAFDVATINRRLAHMAQRAKLRN